jgi:hypothetical protein
MQIMAQPATSNSSYPTVSASLNGALSLNPSIESEWVYASRK